MPHTPASSLGMLTLIVGVICFALGSRMARDLIAPNIFVGFRTPKTLRDNDAWYRANRAVGHWMQRWAIALLLTAGVLAFFTANQGMWVFLPVMYGGAIGLVIVGYRAQSDTALPGAPPRPGTEPTLTSSQRQPPVR